MELAQLQLNYGEECFYYKNAKDAINIIFKGRCVLHVKLMAVIISAPWFSLCVFLHVLNQTVICFQR